MRQSSLRASAPMIPPMPASLDPDDLEREEVELSSLPAHWIRRRGWVYLLLFLLAVALVVVDQRTNGASRSSPASAGSSETHQAP